jgi:CRP-like cAMP-binding protein
MEIILDGLRMVDDGKIKMVGPEPSQNDLAASEPSTRMKALLRGPMVDYIYVVDEESFMDGEVVTQEGKHGGWIWVVLDGTVDIVKSTDRGPEVILSLTEGAFVGSFASFLPGDHVRSAAAVARGDNTQLGVIDAPRLAGEFASLTPAFRRFLISIDKRLKEITDGLLNIRSKQLEAVQVPKDLEPFILDGERKDKLFIIKNGEIAIVRHTDVGQIRLASLSKGDFFGAIPFIEVGHEPHGATVFASADIEVGEVDEKLLNTEYDRQSTTMRNLIEHTAACISISTQLIVEAFLKAKEGRRRAPKRVGKDE